MLRQGDKSSQFPGRVLELRQNGCDAIRDFYLSERINQGKYYFLFKDVDFSQDTAKTKVSWVSHSCSIIVVNLDSHKGTIIEMRMMTSLSLDEWLALPRQPVPYHGTVVS